MIAFRTKSSMPHLNRRSAYHKGRIPECNRHILFFLGNAAVLLYVLRLEGVRSNEDEFDTPKLRVFAPLEPVPIEALLPSLERLELRRRQRRSLAAEEILNPPALVGYDSHLRPSKKIFSTPPPQPLCWRFNEHNGSLTGSAMSVPRGILTSPLVHRLDVILSPPRSSGEHPVPKAITCRIVGAIKNPLAKFLESEHILRPLTNFSIRDRERILTHNSIFRFLFVRHPLTRLAHIHKVYTRDAPSGKVYRGYMEKVRGLRLTEGEHEVATISLQFALMFLMRRQSGLDSSKVDELSSQAEFCGVGIVKWDYVGKVEDMLHGISTIRRRLEVKAAFHSLGDEGSVGGANKFERRVRMRASRLYAKDMRAFHYEP